MCKMQEDRMHIFPYLEHTEFFYVDFPFLHFYHFQFLCLPYWKLGVNAALKFCRHPSCEEYDIFINKLKGIPYEIPHLVEQLFVSRKTIYFSSYEAIIYYLSGGEA